MKKFTIMTIMSITTVLMVSGCSGKGRFSDTNVTIVPSCGTESDKGKSVAISLNNKTIEKTEDGSEVRIWHYPSGEKLGCMITGEANLLDN